MLMLTMIPKPAKDGLEALNKPARRISPFKDRRALLTPAEIFAITPKRIINNRAQSVDRNGFNDNKRSVQKPTITFDSLTSMAPSQTPLRMVSGKNKTSHSEQPISRLSRPTLSSALKSNEPNTNLLERLEKPILKKRRLSPPDETDEPDTDLTTHINTLKNTGKPKDVISFLKSDDDGVTKPKKYRAVKFEKETPVKESTEISELTIMDKLNLILQRQDSILERLERLEKRP